MANDKVAVWNQTPKLGRAPADGELLIGDGEGFTLAGITAGSGASVSVSPGGIQISATGTGTSSVTASSPLASSGGSTPDISLTGVVGVANGGTGASTLTANNVILGDGTDPVQFVAPGASGNVLTSDGTTWASAAPPLAWELIVKSSDTSITSNTTLASDADLQFAMVANTNYLIRAVIFTSLTSPTGGVKIGITGPSSPIRLISTRYSSFTVSSILYPIPFDAATAYGDLVSFNLTNFEYSWTFDLFIENGANAGTFAFQFAQVVSNAAASTFQKGSYLEYKVVA